MSSIISDQPRNQEVQEDLLHTSSKGRLLRGQVVSCRMNKSIVVRVDRRVTHWLYKKYLTKSMKVFAHDENNLCHEGDWVEIKEVRPLSKLKNWTLVQVVRTHDRLAKRVYKKTCKREMTKRKSRGAS